MTDETRPDREALAEVIGGHLTPLFGSYVARDTFAVEIADAVLALIPAPHPAQTDRKSLRQQIHDATAAPGPHPQGGTEALRQIEVLADDLVDRLGGLQGLLSADLEGAYQSGQSLAQKNYISNLMGRANAAWSVAVTIREAAAGRSMPSFEDLLRDPTQQLDQEGVVLQSILDYQRRDPSTTVLCLTPIPLASPTTAGTTLPPTGSVYVCTKPKPCPDHGALLAAAPAPTEADGAGS